MSSSDIDIIIVGAGVSGLSCADRIQKFYKKENGKGRKPLKILIVEASNRVGGRTLVDADGTDLGGAYIGPGQARVHQLISELGLKLKPVCMDGFTIQCLRDSVSYYKGLIPPISVIGALELNAAFVRLQSFATVMKDPAHPELTPDADLLDSQTVEELICQECRFSEDARRLMRLAIKAVFCVEPCEMSILGLMWYFQSNGGANRCIETVGGLQDSKVVGGTGQIAQKLYARLVADSTADSVVVTFSFNTAVRALNYSRPECVTLEVIHGCTQAANTSTDVKREFGTLQAKRIVLAIPPMQQLRIEFTPHLSGNRFQALQRFPMGHIVKTFTYYPEAFWKQGLKNAHARGASERAESGVPARSTVEAAEFFAAKKPVFNGTCVSDSTRTVMVTIDDTQEDGSAPCIMGFVLAEKAAQTCAAFDLTGKAKEQAHRRKAITEDYAKLFNDKRMLQPSGYKEKVWADEPWVGGCYVGVPTPRTLTKFGGLSVIRDPICTDRVFVAGTETAELSCGYIDGAVFSGQKAATDLLAALGKDNAAFQRDVERFVLEEQTTMMKISHHLQPPVDFGLSFVERRLIPTPMQLCVILITIAIFISWMVYVSLRSVK